MNRPKANQNQHQPNQKPKKLEQLHKTKYQQSSEYHDAGHNDTDSTGKPHVRIIHFFGNVKNSTYYNWIAFLGLIVSIGLAIWTFGLFTYARDSALSATSAAELAEKTFKADTAYNHENLRNQKIAQKKIDDAEKDKSYRDQALSKIQLKGAQAQVLALEETKKENEPFLEIMFTGPITYDNGNVSFYYQIYNLGKYPVKAQKMYINVGLVNPVDSAAVIKLIFDKSQVRYDVAREFITSYNPLKVLPYQGSNYKEIDYALFKMGLKCFLVCGQMIYKDVLYNKLRMYKFVYRLKYIDEARISYNVIVNDNTIIKKQR